MQDGMLLKSDFYTKNFLSERQANCAAAKNLAGKVR